MDPTCQSCHQNTKPTVNGTTNIIQTFQMLLTVLQEWRDKIKCFTDVVEEHELVKALRVVCIQSKEVTNDAPKDGEVCIPVHPMIIAMKDELVSGWASS